jgi:hypothetical protein
VGAIVEGDVEETGLLVNFNVDGVVFVGHCLFSCELRCRPHQL